MILRAPTHTRVSLSLSSAELSAEYAKLACDGVVLMCAESCARSLGVHPRKLLTDGSEEKFLDLFSRNIVRVARDFAPRPVVYRTLDMNADEYAGLQGGAEFEQKEGNPMRGLRGCGRYIADETSFRLELRAVKRARDMGCVNVDAMLPFARFPDELSRCREVVIEEGLFASAEFELWMMADVPANLPLIEEFLGHVSGILIGSSDLPQLVPGTDHDGRHSASHLDDYDPAALAAITRVARACQQRAVSCAICGGEPALHAEIVRALIEAGLTGWSVAPESLQRTVEAVAAAEAELGILPEREVAK